MTWAGECNRCGLCCTQVVDGVPTRCEHLEIVSSSEAICGKYADRHQGMPILLVDNNGRGVKVTYCTPDYPHQLGRHIQLPSKCGYHWVESAP